MKINIVETRMINQWLLNLGCEPMKESSKWESIFGNGDEVVAKITVVDKDVNNSILETFETKSIKWISLPVKKD